MNSLDSIASITGVSDLSTVLRETISVYDEQLLLARMVTACALYADESAAIAESFGAADSILTLDLGNTPERNPAG